MGRATANLHLTFHKPNADLVPGLPPNTHIVPSRHADGAHIHLLECACCQQYTIQLLYSPDRPGVSPGSPL